MATTVINFYSAAAGTACTGLSDGSTLLGTITVNADTASVAGKTFTIGGDSSSASFFFPDDTSHTTDLTGSTGTVTFSAGGTELKGTFDVMATVGDGPQTTHVNGTFDAPLCEVQ